MYFWLRDQESDLAEENWKHWWTESQCISMLWKKFQIRFCRLVAGVSRMRTMVISVAIGLLEVIGVWLGFALGTASATFLPIMLGFAGGAMLYVTSDEMIPETHAHGYQKQATYALLLGFMTLLLIERFFE